jgi:hypothetical protein
MFFDARRHGFSRLVSNSLLLFFASKSFGQHVSGCGTAGRYAE